VNIHARTPSIQAVKLSTLHSRAPTSPPPIPHSTSYLVGRTIPLGPGQALAERVASRGHEDGLGPHAGRGAVCGGGHLQFVA